MLQITDVIVSFLFLPVTLFIIIPLLMLCGWMVFKFFLKLKGKLHMPKKKAQLEDVEIQTEGSL